MAWPREINTEMATTDMNARIKAYSTNVWPFLLFNVRNNFFMMGVKITR